MSVGLLVGDLRRQLQDLPANLPVFLASDEEGNRIMVLAEAERGEWSAGEERLVAEEDVGDDRPDDVIDCFVLWP